LSLATISNSKNSSSHSFISSGYLYSATPSTLLLRGALDTARILYRSFTSKRHGQLWVKDLPKRRLERNSTPRPFGQKAPNLPMSHQSTESRGKAEHWTDW